MFDDELKVEDINVTKDLKIIFMGTPAFSVPILEALIAKYKIRAVVTRPDKATGRDLIMTEPPIKTIAKQHNILVLQPVHLKDEYQEILALEPDLIITCAYGQMVPNEILMAPRLGCINVHASLLPKLRGGAPIERAIMNGFSETGVTIMYMNPRMDEGDMIAKSSLPIMDDDTGESLRSKLMILGRDLLMTTLPKIIEGTNDRIPQNNEEATLAPIIKRNDEHLNFNETKRQINNQIRALNDHPGAYATFNGSNLKIWKAYISPNFFPEKFDGEITALYEDGFGLKVSNGEIIVTEVQPEGKKKMSALEFAHGQMNHTNFIGGLFS